jgi:Putative peptidoglycan binding domain
MNMLPAVSNFKTKTIAALTALAIAVPAAPALAWGQRERDVLTGVVGALVVESLIRNSRHHPHVVQPQRPIYVEPPPVYHKPHPQYDRVITLNQTAAARAFNSYSRTERRLIQRQLARAGYYYGGIDGTFGRGTYSAVTAYAQDHGQSMGNTAAAFGVYDGLLY